MPDLVHPKEKLYFTVSLVVTLIVYVTLAVTVVMSPETLLGLGFYVVLFTIMGLVAKGLFIGHLRGNGVRISHEQFPEVFQAASSLSQSMGMPMPDIYVIQSGGLLNAFATRFIGRNFVVVYSDILELAYEQGDAEVNFVIAHEMAHLKRRHLTWRLVLLPSQLVPFLGAAYSRGCEYTCDRYGGYYSPQGAALGIAILACGKKLFRRLSLAQYSAQVEGEKGFWVWYAEKLSTHPRLPKRLAAIQELLTQTPPVTV